MRLAAPSVRIVKWASSKVKLVSRSASRVRPVSTKMVREATLRASSADEVSTKRRMANPHVWSVVKVSLNRGKAVTQNAVTAPSANFKRLLGRVSAKNVHLASFSIQLVATAGAKSVRPENTRIELEEVLALSVPRGTTVTTMRPPSALHATLGTIRMEWHKQSVVPVLKDAFKTQLPQPMPTVTTAPWGIFRIQTVLLSVRLVNAASTKTPRMRPRVWPA